MPKERFCKRFKEAIRRLKSKFNQFIENHIDTALRITQAVKAAIDNPVTDMLVHLTKTEVDDKIRDKIIIALDIAIAKLMIGKECNVHTDLNDKIKCWIEHIKLQPVDVQDALLVKLGALVASELDSNKESQHIYDAAIQSVYSVKKVA